MADHQVNLFKSYEEKTFNKAFNNQKELPCIIFTGALGSGKTTLLKYILNNREGLRIAILVNEVGDIDIDSQYLNVEELNNRSGVPYMELSGGCACCVVQDSLDDAVQTVLQNNANLDLMVIETSGVADPTNIIFRLLNKNVKLEAVIAVIDTESGQDVLETQIGKQQVKCSDLVILNKCDLASLVTISKVEDMIEEIMPNQRSIRSRYGQVPIDALISPEVNQVERESLTFESPNDDNESQKPQKIERGSEAFLSHESTFSKPAVQGMAKKSKWQNTEQFENQNMKQHVHVEDSQVYRESIEIAQTIQLFQLQQLIAQVFVKQKGLLRMKSVIRFQSLSSYQFAFQMSGKMRIENIARQVQSSNQYQQQNVIVVIAKDQETINDSKKSIQRCTTRQFEANQQQQESNKNFVQFVNRLTQIDDRLQFQIEGVDILKLKCISKSTIFQTIQYDQVNGIMMNSLNLLLEQQLKDLGIFFSGIQSDDSISYISNQQARSQRLEWVIIQIPPDFNQYDDLYAQMKCIFSKVFKQVFGHMHSLQCDAATARAAE